jgi:hypothetical protein
MQKSSIAYTQNTLVDSGSESGIIPQGSMNEMCSIETMAASTGNISGVW